MAEEERTPRRVGILGTAPSTRNDIPWGAPIEFASLNDAWKLPGYAEHCKVWFELHQRDWFTSANRPPDHLQWLQKFPGKVYMWETHPDIPNSVRYPWEEVIARFRGCTAYLNTIRQGEGGQLQFVEPKGYVTSTITEMMAVYLLEMQAGDEMYFWGVDLGADTEYARQRPNFEWFAGLCEGLRIKTYLPQACPLCRGPYYGRGSLEGDFRAEFHQLLEQEYYKEVNTKRRLESQLVEKQGGLKVLEALRARYPTR